MSLSKSKRAQVVALGLALLAAPAAAACDKTASADRVSKVVATGEIQRPTRVSKGFAVEVSEKYWASADHKQKSALAADVACAIGTDTVSFARDRKFLGIFHDGKYEALN